VALLLPIYVAAALVINLSITPFFGGFLKNLALSEFMEIYQK